MHSSVRAEVEVRATMPGDREKLRGMFSRLSPRTIYMRFHRPYPRVPEWALDMFLNTDHHDSESLIATVRDEIVGRAMYVRSNGGREAEAAIFDEASRQSKGVGKLLLCKLAGIARGRGIADFAFEVLGENQQMLGLASAMFAGSTRKARDGSHHVSAPLRTLARTADVPVSGCAA